MNEWPQLSVEPGLYRHFKGGLYEVLSVARDSETDAAVVVYKPHGSDQVWVRAAAMFVEQVEANGSTVARFSPVAGAKNPSYLQEA